MDDAIKTLFALYKFSAREYPSEEEIADAKAKGILFDYPKYESHSAALSRLRSILARIDPKDIANAFLFSLSTRRLEYRSALGSYYYAKAIPEHDFMNSFNEVLARAARHCYFCGWDAWASEPSKFEKRFGVNIYNYERYKYAGVRHDQLNYSLFDLEQFIGLPKVVPTEEDLRIFTDILSCVKCLNASDKAGRLRDTISKAKIFKTNKNEISVLLGELGICGILAGQDAPSYDIYFANEYERTPVESKNDFAYPLNRWHARDGINTEKLNEVFGLALDP